MKDIIIVGAGGFGREAYYLIKAINAVDPRWNVKGFINDIPVDLRSKKIDVPIIGAIKDWQPSENEVFALGLSRPKDKRKVVEILKRKGACFATIIHPRAMILDDVELGEGCIVGGTSYIGACAKLGDFVFVAGSVVGQDRIIGDFSTITDSANVATGNVGRNVFVGSHSVVLKDVSDDAILAAGSIVMKRVKQGEIVFGNPAHVVGRVDEGL